MVPVKAPGTAHAQNVGRVGRGAAMPDFNWPAFVICMAVYVFFFVMGIIWTRKPETRTRGIVTLAVLLVPTAMSALVLVMRVFV